MSGGNNMDFEVRVACSVAEIGQTAWDGLGGSLPFASYQWYSFGEKVMSDCQPIYFLLSKDGNSIARATFWLVREEPLPVHPFAWAILRPLLRRWPLLICRSPLSNTSGLILPEPPIRQAALETLISSARSEAVKYNASYLVFDYLDEGTARWDIWPRGFTTYTDPDPGTCLSITWKSFEEYLQSLSPKSRKHYRQYNRDAGQSGLCITRHDSIEEVEEAVTLIRNVEARHHSPPNPWTRALLRLAGQNDGLWLVARQDGRMVGCELILKDRDAHMVTCLGLAADVPHVYHMLGYADIRHAIETDARILRWGSGAHQVKRRLGFEMESNNNAVVIGRGFFTKLAKMIAG